MTDPIERHPAYVALCPTCGHICGVTLAHPKHADHTAATVAEWIRDGLTVQHTPPGEARRRLDADDWCECAVPSATQAALL